MSRYKVTKEPTDIFGLLYKPVIYNMNADRLPEHKGCCGDPPEHFTECDAKVLLEAFDFVDGDVNTIVEIGVHRPGKGTPRSSTKVLIDRKSSDATFIGIDTEDRGFIIEWADGVHFIRSDSKNKEFILDAFKELSVENIDLLFIDGHHSVNQVVAEWNLYIPLLKVGGVVGFHDVGGHPGPYTIYDAIDEKIFSKSGRRCRENDYGIGFAKRIK